MKIKLYQIIIVLVASITVIYFFIKMLIFETKEEVYKILSETEYLMINGDWLENIDTRYEYNEDGDRISMIVLKFYKGNWINEYKVNYLYDKNNSIIGELYQTWKNNQWIDSLKIENFTKNSESGYISYNLLSGKILPSEKFAVKIDTVDKRKEEIKYIYENFEWRPIEITTTILNIELNPLEKTIKKTFGNSLKYITSSKYQYDLSGLELSEEIFKWNDTTMTKFEKFINEYDTNGVQLSRRWQKWNGKEWINGWVCHYSYDPNGNLTTLEYKVWKDNIWIPDERYRYTYNNENIGTAHYIDRWKDSKWTDSLKNIYSFGKFTVKKKINENFEINE